MRKKVLFSSIAVFQSLRIISQPARYNDSPNWGLPGDYPEGAPINGGSWILIILGLLFGVYRINKNMKLKALKS
jgi:hypothetical protein